MSSLRELFGPGGGLSRSLDGFVSRRSQLRMAERIETALAMRETLLVEAGTGTGKTFAYLVPALQSGLRVLISTGTRTLQDQLYARDLPLLSAALGRPARVALLKGRANYLCRARLEHLAVQPELWSGRAEQALRLQQWAHSTRSGDLSELSELGESDPRRHQLVSTRESCTGSRCSQFAQCHVFAARRAAMEADIVVVNHHLLLADMALKEEGYGDLLPSVDALILDEAHQLPDLAAEFFGEHCSSRQLDTLLHDSERALQASAVPAARRRSTLQLLEQPLGRLISELAGKARRVAWSELGSGTRDQCSQLCAALEKFAAAMEACGESADIVACSGRARAMHGALRQITEPALAEGARSVTAEPRGFALHLLPYDVATRFQALVQQRPAAWVFTSATLALAGNFSHFADRLGVGDAATLCVDSPFDYERQALLYLPRNMPDPAAPNYLMAVLAVARPLIEAAQGGAFLLFTSHRALAAAAAALQADARGLEFELLIQGSAPRERLLQRFRQSGRCLLLGTASFWEGVDVQGMALRLVVIDKLPFAHIDDPLVRARVEYLQSRGGNPFRDYQLPDASLALKQGVGRLIRSEQDRGVVVICDPRLRSRGYGRSMLASLPPMRVTEDPDEAVELLQDCAQAHQPQPLLEEPA